MEKRGLLPVGFRFNPTDEEIIVHYLLKKVIDSRFTALAISEADLNKCEPWDLPNKAKMGEEKEWYFFCQRDRKYSTGMRTNRATESGYWKATGKDRGIFYNINKSSNNNKKGLSSSLVGMKKTLVFYKGRAPNGEKTNWVMHEYRLIDEGKNNYFSTYYNLFSNTDDKDRWVVCRVIQKNDVGMSRRSQTNSTYIKLARIDTAFVNHLIGDNDHYDDATLKLPPPLFSNISCHDHGVEREFIDDDNIASSSTSLSYYNDLESEILVRQQCHDELKPNVLLPPHNTDQLINSTVYVHPHQQSPSMFEYNKQYFPFMNNAHVQRNLGFIPPSNNILMQSNNNMSVAENGVSEINGNAAADCEIASVEDKKRLLDEGLGGVISFSPDMSELLVDSLWDL